MDWLVVVGPGMGMQRRWFASKSAAVAWAKSDVSEWKQATGRSPEHRVIYQPSGAVEETIRDNSRKRARRNSYAGPLTITHDGGDLLIRHTRDNSEKRFTIYDVSNYRGVTIWRGTALDTLDAKVKAARATNRDIMGLTVRSFKGTQADIDAGVGGDIGLRTVTKHRRNASARRSSDPLSDRFRNPGAARYTQDTFSASFWGPTWREVPRSVRAEFWSDFQYAYNGSLTTYKKATSERTNSKTRTRRNREELVNIYDQRMVWQDTVRAKVTETGIASYSGPMALIGGHWHPLRGEGIGSYRYVKLSPLFLQERANGACACKKRRNRYVR